MRRTWSVMMLALWTSACAVGVQLPREELTSPGALLFNGYTNPKVDCFRCHNGDGKGARGPSLIKRVPASSDEELRKVVTKGGRRMPSFGEKVSDDEVTQLVEWLRQAFPGT